MNIADNPTPSLWDHFQEIIADKRKYEDIALRIENMMVFTPNDQEFGARVREYLLSLGFGE